VQPKPGTAEWAQAEEDAMEQWAVSCAEAEQLQQQELEMGGLDPLWLVGARPGRTSRH
jgi:hypothetical protein